MNWIIEVFVGGIVFVAWVVGVCAVVGLICAVIGLIVMIITSRITIIRRIFLLIMLYVTTWMFHEIGMYIFTHMGQLQEEVR